MTVSVSTLVNDQLALAMHIANFAHLGQEDKSGLAYIGHLLRVAARVSYSRRRMCAALLHDAVEDTSVTFRQLLTWGVDPLVIDAVRLLTHDKKTTTYREYVEKILRAPGLAGQIARDVKLADLTDNSDPARHYKGQKKSTLEKYEKAKSLLGGRGWKL